MGMRAALVRFGMGLVALLGAPLAAQPRAPLVLAAASLHEALSEAGDVWARAGHPRPVLSFAASSALARQIVAGAPADLFISADAAWMDELAKKSLIRRATRATLARNQLVLIAPAARPLTLKIARGFALRRALGRERLAIADPDAVPAGRYAKAALDYLGVWQAVAPQIVRADNVRAALQLVAHDEVRAGIVYATDARATRAVRVIGSFPAASHRPIVYPIAQLSASSNREASGFSAFLLSRSGQAIFARHGFLVR